MALTPGLTCTRDLFAKLQRDVYLLEEEVNTDRFFNFVVTGYSLIDWVKNDPSVPSTAKDDPAVASLYKDRWLKTCGDIANASKHFTLKFGLPITKSVTAARGFGLGRYGKGDYGQGEERIIVELNDGATFDCFDLIQGVLSVWNQFFARYGI